MGEAKRREEARQSKFIKEAEILQTLESNDAFKLFLEIVEENKNIYSKNSELGFEQYRTARCYKTLIGDNDKNYGVIPVNISLEEFNNFRNENLAKEKALDVTLNIINKAKSQIESIKENSNKKESDLEAAQKRFEELNAPKV